MAVDTEAIDAGEIGLSSCLVLASVVLRQHRLMGEEDHPLLVYCVTPHGFGKAQSMAECQLQGLAYDTAFLAYAVHALAQQSLH